MPWMHQISCAPSWKSVKFGLLWYSFALHQMTPLHLAVEKNHTKIVECLLDQGADFNLQDKNEVILHTYEVEYFQLAGRCCIYWLFFTFLCCLEIGFSVIKLYKARFCNQDDYHFKHTIRNTDNLYTYLDSVSLLH